MQRTVYHIMRPILLLLLFVLLVNEADAQCAMCKAVLESEQALGETSRSQGINNGILYLMGVPYLLIASFLVFNYKDELLKMLKDAS